MSNSPFSDNCEHGGLYWSCSRCNGYTELATLREQLVDAMKVLDAVRVWSDNPLAERDADLVEALRDYDAKHGRK